MVQWNKVIPRWAGDIVEPPESKKDEGYLVGDRPPASWENWFRKGVYEAMVENRSVIDSLDSGKAGLSWTQGQLNTLGTDKADKSWVTTELDKKANTTALTGHTGATNNPHSVTKSQVGLGRVDNTNDLEKPISTATQSALNLKANQTALDTHVGKEDNPHKVTKAQVGLGKVNNTTDAEKPISTATATALGLKADKTELTAGLGLKADKTALTNGLAGKVDANSPITAGTFVKVKVDTKGLVTGNESLVASDIPSLDAGKITTGTLGVDRIPQLAIAKIDGLATALNGKTTEAYVDSAIQSAIMDVWDGVY